MKHLALMLLLTICGTSHGILSMSVPTSGFCASGHLTGGMVNSDRWTWICQDGDIKEACSSVTLAYCLKHCKVCIPGEQAFCPDEVTVK